MIYLLRKYNSRYQKTWDESYRAFNFLSIRQCIVLSTNHWSRNAYVIYLKVLLIYSSWSITSDKNNATKQAQKILANIIKVH